MNLYLIDLVLDTSPNYFSLSSLTLSAFLNSLNFRFAPASVTDEAIGSKWLYDFLAQQWNSWLPETALETLRIGGYYTLTIRPGWRIIAMNSNPCYTGNL